MDLEILTHSFPNLGFITADVPKDVLATLNPEITEIQNNFDLAKPWNNNLAGNIQKEFLLQKEYPELKEFILAMRSAYDEVYSYTKTYCTTHAVDSPFFINNLWVNFQHKHEFNPMHTHGGVFSFVIWYKIPYLIETEREISPCVCDERNKAAYFQFAFTDVLGNIRNFDLPVDQTYEGKIAFFPSKMKHNVNPFYSSDEYRISVAGNVALDNR